ncbi:Aste57867_21905 [Aphanomyces stellatus]|uniref:Aste57867_21905 protein n=1 Tax=Aphanomyces stellatus TaxID=120398 RepID=A0A485LIS1_9STRA|nr:hypothetical protein As57867_021836 [Aphanomyces stellatus]VFT98573.1 Aste57867_21905 [Aphanomyces stellatus]
MERTGEFTRITQLFSDAPIIMAKHRPLSKYARVAQQISDAISQSESLLKDLANLATKKHLTVEDDPAKQISDIVDIVKKSIPPTLQDIEMFEKAVTGDNQQQKHFYIVCSSLKTRMSNCGKALQEGMQSRATVIKKQSERRTKFGFTGQAPSVQIHTPLTIRNNLNTPLHPTATTPLGTNHAHVSAPGPAAGPTQGLHPVQPQGPDAAAGMRRRPFMNGATGSSYAQQQQQQNLMRHRTAQSRLNDAQNVEAMIGEIGGMYSRMTGLLANQEEMLGRIEDDMTTAHSNVEGGYEELMKYFSTVSSNRSLILKIFLVLLVFIYLFLVVLPKFQSPRALRRAMRAAVLLSVATTIIISGLPLNGWFDCAVYTFPTYRRLEAAVGPQKTSPWFNPLQFKAASAASSSSSGSRAQCGTFAAPLCYPGVCTSSRNIDVFVKRIVGSDSSTTKAIYILQGGPGASSVNMEPLMVNWAAMLRGTFNVYTIDHRGTGRSELLGCDGTQAQTAGSDGGTTVTLDELPRCLHEMQRNYDYQAAAFSITSAANDVAAVINSLPESEVYVYGVSYGTALVARLMHLSPAKVKGYVLDSVQSEDYTLWTDSPTYSNWDRDFGVVANRFLDLCTADSFCGPKFPTRNLRNDLTTLYAALDGGTSPCTTFVQAMGDDTPSNILRAFFGVYFADMELRLRIPVFVYRLLRCTADDLTILGFVVNGGGNSGSNSDAPPSSTADAPNSDLLYNTIVYSELWQRPTLSYDTLVAFFENSLISSGVASSLPTYCVFAGATQSDPSCRAIANVFPRDAAPAINFTYAPDAFFNVTARIPPGASVMVLSGKLDPQTPSQYAERQFALMAGANKVLFEFPVAAHAMIETTPVTNPNAPTCGVSLVLSYVQMQGDVTKVDSTCMASVQPLVFSFDAWTAKAIFNVTDAFDGIPGHDVWPTTTTVSPTTVIPMTATTAATAPETYETPLIVASAILAVLVIAMLVLVALLNKFHASNSLHPTAAVGKSLEQ